MNVENATMAIPRYEARESYRAYQAAIKERRATRDDVMLYRGLRALLRGQKVLDINLAIGNGGRDQRGRPLLAIARATWPTVTAAGRWDDGRLVMQFTSTTWGRKPAGVVVVRGSCFPTDDSIPALNSITCSAQVPSIPPQHRPAGDLGDYHILFEAEWLPRPPGDPLLLKRIDGPFFVVLAAWDLSPLEQAVLRQRL